MAVLTNPPPPAPLPAEVSALAPIDPASVDVAVNVNVHAPEEEEEKAPWIVRKIVGSMTGRIVMSSYETLRATGTTVVCLSPWGDSSPLFLPCIRFRDLVVHSVIAATGGMAAVAAPVMGPMSDIVVGSLGDSILVELGLHAGFGLGTTAANDLVFSKPISAVIPIHSARLETTAVKVLLITLRYKHTMTDAAMGFYRSSLHDDPSLFSAVKDYLGVEKGWFSPYLFASARRPVIPRSIKPDVIFCHGPFLAGDYRVAETLLAESASVIELCAPPAPAPSPSPAPGEPEHAHHHALDGVRRSVADTLPKLTAVFHRSRSRSPTPTPTPTEAASTPAPASIPAPLPAPAPRRLLIAVLGLRPHRALWTSSARPAESVLHYILLNGCPALVLPAKPGAPLVAWAGVTLEQMWAMALPPDVHSEAAGREMEERGGSREFERLVDTLFEYVALSTDWARVRVGGRADGGTDAGADAKADAEDAKDDGKAGEDAESGPGSGGLGDVGAGGGAAKEALRDALALLVAAAIRSAASPAARRELDAARSGIAMWRLP